MNDNKNQSNKTSNIKRSNRSNYKRGPRKENNKNLIIFKSFAISLGIVLIVMMVSLIFKINNKDRKSISNCSNKEKSISLKSQIIQIENIANNKVIAITKAKNGTQEILIIDKCLKIEEKRSIKYQSKL